MNTQDQNPLVSIIVPTFDRPALVREALDSVRAQNYPHWEAVVVDDGSTQATLAILAEYSRRDSRIRSLRRERQPKGASTCRNIGLAAARGDYIVFLDSDDLLAPGCLDRRAEATRRNPECDFIAFQSVMFNKEPGDLGRLWNVDNGEPDLNRFLRGDSPWNTDSVLWKKTALQTINAYDEELKCWQDIDIHLRALLASLRYQTRFKESPDAFVRRHAEPTISQNGFKSRETVSSVFRVYEKTFRALTPLADAGVQNGLRYMLSHAVQLAFDNRYLDMAAQGLTAGRRGGLLSTRQHALWRIAFACYAAHRRGVRGSARLGQRLLRPYQPQLEIGVHSLSDNNPF